MSGNVYSAPVVPRVINNRRWLTKAAWIVCLVIVVLATFGAMVNFSRSYNALQSIDSALWWIGAMVMAYTAAHAVDRITI